MLVDDDRDFLDIHQRLLEANGYRVICCAEAAQAAARLDQDKPDLVISDLMMGALDSGFTLAKQIKAKTQGRPIPVIVVTAVANRLGFDFSPRSAEEFETMGADAFFDKPADPGSLLGKIRELLQQKQAE